MFSNGARKKSMRSRHLAWILSVAALAFFGCAEDTGGGTGGTAGAGGTGGNGGTLPDATLVVTADWLNQSLTLLDYDALVDGQSDAEEAILRTIDLSEWEPGPLELEITPDGATAVVSVSPGFFDGTGLTNMIIGAPTVPAGGTLLIVDLATGAAESIATEDVPMGIAISPDGTRVYTANYGTIEERGDSLSVIDLVTREVIEEIQVGSGPEQVVLSPDGSLGAINVASADGVRVFQTADVAGTLTDVVPTGNDPSDIAFLGGNTRILVANSQGFNVTLIDTSDPSAPSPLQNFTTQGGVPYGLTYVPGRNIVLAAMSRLPANFVTIDIDGDVLMPSLPDALPGGSFPLTVGVDAMGDFAFVAHVSDQEFSIIDLDTGDIRAISWLGPFGPTYVAVQR